MNLDSACAEWRRLQSEARAVRDRAWARYSKFQVGAALLTSDGQVVTGCNVENSSYGLTICAERAAVCAAVALGFTSFTAICISLDGVPVPCGACRQFLVEFAPEMVVLLDDINRPMGSPPEALVLSDLLPRTFRLD